MVYTHNSILSRRIPHGLQRFEDQMSTLLIKCESDLALLDNGSGQPLWLSPRLCMSAAPTATIDRASIKRCVLHFVNKHKHS